MRDTKRFYINRSGQLICETKEEDLEMLYQGDDAISYLEELDKITFDKVIVTENSVRLINNNTRVIIQNPGAFYKQGLTDLFPNTYKTMKKAMVKYTKSQAQGKKRQNIKRGTKVVQITSLVFMLLAGGATAKKVMQNHTDEPPITFSVEEMPTEDDLKIDEEIESALLEEEPVLSNELLTELEQELEEDQPIEEAIKETPEIADETIEEESTEALTQDLEAENPVYLDFKLTQDRVKKEYASSQYYDLCCKGAETYGWSVNVPMSILTQESGGKEQNLMQIEFDEWKDKEQRIYNFKTHSYDVFMLTNTPEKYQGKDYIIVTENDLNNPEVNILTGCALLRKSAEYMEYHFLAGILCYNQGKGNMDDILAETAKETGQNIDDILADQTNVTFDDYTYISGVGDPNYLSNVFAFLDNYGEEITFKHFQDGEIVEEHLNIFSHQQVL